MKLIKKVFWNGLFITTILLSGCSKKDNNTNPSGSNDYVEPTFANDTLIKIPSEMRDKAENGGDYNLTWGVAQIDLINFWTSDLSKAFFYDQSEMDGWASTKNSDGSFIRVVVEI